jgi:F420H(2)-dependent biliverdin reductase
MKLTLDLAALDAATQDFLTEFHVAVMTTTRPDGSLHGAGIGFTYDLVTRQCWLIAQNDSVKVRNIIEGSRALVAQVEGSRWLSLEGKARVDDEPEVVAEAERRYAIRYPGHGNPAVGRVAIIINVERIVGIPWRREPNNR